MQYDFCSYVFDSHVKAYCNIKVVKGTGPESMAMVRIFWFDSISFVLTMQIYTARWQIYCRCKNNELFLISLIALMIKESFYLSEFTGPQESQESFRFVYT